MLEDPDDFLPARYQAAIDLIRLEGERMLATFSAFLVAASLVAAFLLPILAKEGRGPLLLGGGVLGLLITACWWASYERQSSAYDFRIAVAAEVEPPGWGLLRGRGAEFSDNKEVYVGGKRYERHFIATMKTKWSKRILVLVFAVGFAVVSVIGLVRWAASSHDAPSRPVLRPLPDLPHRR